MGVECFHMFPRRMVRPRKDLSIKVFVFWERGKSRKPGIILSNSLFLYICTASLIQSRIDCVHFQRAEPQFILFQPHLGSLVASRERMFKIALQRRPGRLETSAII